MNTPNRIFGLDFMRAFAVLIVVFHHSFAFWNAPEWLKAWGWLGEIGVECLLVLSGYLIGTSLLNKSINGRFSKLNDLGQFYMRRWTRTLPPYYFYLLLMAAFFPPFFQQLVTRKEYFFFLQNFAWNIPGFYCQTWTLALLEFFYLLFPLLFLLASKIVRNQLARIFVPILLLLCIPLTLRAMHTPIALPDEFEDTFRKWVIFRLDTPIIGVIAAVIQVKLPVLWLWFLQRTWIGLTTFSLVMIYHYVNCPYLYSSHWLQVIFYPVCALALLPLMPFLCHWKSNQSLFGKMTSSISQVSYTLYVSHFLALNIGFCLLGIMGISHDKWYVAYPVYLLLILLIACPSYYLTEAPFISLRERKPQSLFVALGKLCEKYFLVRWPALSPTSPPRFQPDASTK